MRQLVGRIYFSDASGHVTESAESLVVELAAAVGIDAATIYHTSGVWRGAREHGFVFEVIQALDAADLPAEEYENLELATAANIRAKLGAIAETVRERFAQEAVLVRIVSEHGSFDLV